MEFGTADEIPEMMEQKNIKIPTCYAEWLDCFRILENRMTDTNDMALLRQGSCRDADISIEYLEKQLIRTENAMLKKYIAKFQSDLMQYLNYHDYDGLYRVFEVLAKRMEGCLFFAELDFMSTQFRRSLADSVRETALTFWNNAVGQLSRLCIEQPDILLEDQLFMIRRIRLFREGEKGTL